MSAAAPFFRRIQQVFRDVGINDDVQIASHVAFLLLVRDQWEQLQQTRYYDLQGKLAEMQRQLQQDYPGLQHIPEPPPARRASDRQVWSTIDLLRQAIDQSPHGQHLGTFFQREVRFELLKSAHGAQYPTPYHISRLMAELGVSGMFADVFDPAAGSGGLLAAAHELGRPANSTDVSGCEYDASWSALSATNILLHDRDRGATLILGSGLGYTDSRVDPFNTVLMNPPFSGSRPIAEISNALHTSDYGTSTVNALCVKALQLLQAGGRAVFLVPSGTLFGSGANARLRALLARHHLEAIATLDKECFQPFSHVNAHVVVVQKHSVVEAPTTKPVWMCNVVRDGYPTGAGRDLTAEPDPGVNELPRVRDLVKRARDQHWSIALNISDDLQVEACLLHPTDGLPGAAVRCNTTGEIGWHITGVPSGTLVEVGNAQNRAQGLLHLPFRSGTTASIATFSIAGDTQAAWTELVSSTIWDDSVAAKWTNGSEAVHISTEVIDGARNMELKAGSRGNTIRASFTSAETDKLNACFLDQSGQPVGPWLFLQDNTLDLDDKTGETLQAISILTVGYQRCGWLLDLTEVQEVNAGDADAPNEPRTGWLLIAEPTLLGYFATVDDRWALLLRSSGTEAQQGWLHGDRRDAGSIQIEIGEALALRNDFSVQGFAIGTSPEPGNASSTVFGVLVPHSHLVPVEHEPRTFEPRAYLPEPPPAPVAHPSTVVSRIRKNQVRLGLQVDSLLQMLGNAPVRSSASDGQPPTYLNKGLLDERQRKVWEVIQEINDASGRPRLFSVSELRSQCQTVGIEVGDGQLGLTLTLLVRLGLIIEGHTDQYNGYRRIGHGDLVSQEALSE